ncbi:RND transporter [Rubrivivax sp. A210]|uniref:efflux transporter outer membrane subunit n=1 Tax=Rubrivivax sp. A210 TaxID=2772301 RepID=UPI0019C04BD7|nr:efflux transporter outer membrane subunit [Rubrivivax sp. A210]CAD5365936.1 RND transporter [Rubrivivax sp. A210]
MKAGAIRAGLAAGLLSLGGCAALRAGDPVSLPADVPAAWSQASTPGVAAGLAQWWQRFDDTLLTQLVADALQANTGVQGAQAALRQARALSAVSGAGLWPQVGSAASAQTGTRGGRGSGTSFQAGLDASWEMDLFGGARARLASSEATASASAARLADVQVSLAAEVALNYITLRSAQARLAIADANLASQSQTLQITGWRVQAGLLSMLESEQAHAAVAQLAAARPALQTRIAQSAHALAVITGRPPAALAAELSAPGRLPRAAAEPLPDPPAETLNQRPDVRAAAAQVLAAQGQVAQADAARYPGFSLGGSLGSNAATLGALGNGANLVTSLLARVSWPLWDGGAASAQLEAQQAGLAQASSAYRGTVLAALQEVEDTLVALRGDHERVTQLRQASAAAVNAATLARQRHAGGLVDFQTVLETQRSQLGAQDSLAGAEADAASDQVRLFKALGGGWPAPADNSRPPSPTHGARPAPPSTLPGPPAR